MDGHVYVRNVGKSDRATSADIRRLSSRMLPPGKLLERITINPVEDSRVAVIDYPSSWLDDWLHAEEDRLLAPLRPAPPPLPSERRLGEVGERPTRASALGGTARDSWKIGLGSVVEEEDRTEDAYREEIGAYLYECREGLEEAFEDLRQASSLGVMLEIVNATSTNYEKVLVELHIEGDVFGYESEGHFTEIAEYLPRPPRKWGPGRREPFEQFRIPGYSHLLGNSFASNLGSIGPDGPRPTIINGGSVNATCVPLHLYQRTTTELLTIWLVGCAPLDEPVGVSWTATASNVDGKLEGMFTIPVLQDTWDLSERLKHSQG